MPKYYEPEHFEDCYSSFLEGNLSNGYYSYIDPDCVEDVGKTDFYKDLTDFLNDMWVHSPPLGAQANFNRMEKRDTM